MSGGDFFSHFEQDYLYLTLCVFFFAKMCSLKIKTLALIN